MDTIEKEDLSSDQKQIASMWAMVLNSGSSMPDLIWDVVPYPDGTISMTPNYLLTMQRRASCGRA